MPKPLLHLVFGGEARDPHGTDFVDISSLHFVGIFPNYAKALGPGAAPAQMRVDHAHVKYVIVHLHRLLDPGEDGEI